MVGNGGCSKASVDVTMSQLAPHLVPVTPHLVLLTERERTSIKYPLHYIHILHVITSNP